MIGFVLVLCLLVGAAFGPALAPRPPDALVGSRLLDPGTQGFTLGTDHIGRDELSRLLHGFRQTVVVAFSAMTISIVLATIIGLTSGWAGGWVDLILQRVIDAVMSFPSLVLLIAVVSVVGGGLIQLITTLGVISSVAGSRVVRSAVLNIRSESYFEAARAVGASTGRIVWYHVLPNMFGPLMVIATLNLGTVVLVEASLSFLGLGIADPALPTWGRMLFDARPVLSRQPLLAVWPGMLIALTVFGFNMLGDALRDILDPRLRRA